MSAYSLTALKIFFLQNLWDQYLINDNTKHSLVKDIQICSNHMKDKSLYEEDNDFFYFLPFIFANTNVFTMYLTNEFNSYPTYPSYANITWVGAVYAS